MPTSHTPTIPRGRNVDIQLSAVHRKSCRAAALPQPEAPQREPPVAQPSGEPATRHPSARPPVLPLLSRSPLRLPRAGRVEPSHSSGMRNPRSGITPARPKPREPRGADQDRRPTYRRNEAVTKVSKCLPNRSISGQLWPTCSRNCPTAPRMQAGPMWAKLAPFVLSTTPGEPCEIRSCPRVAQQVRHSSANIRSRLPNCGHLWPIWANTARVWPQFGRRCPGWPKCHRSKPMLLADLGRILADVVVWSSLDRISAPTTTAAQLCLDHFGSRQLHCGNVPL